MSRWYKKTEPMVLKMRRFIKTTLHFPFILALVLVLSLAGGTVLANTLLGWPDDGTFQVAVDKKGHMRLLSQNPTSYEDSEDEDDEGDDEDDEDDDKDKKEKKDKDKLKKDEFLIELPSRELVATLEDLLSELEITISGLESEVGGQQSTISSLQSTISSLQGIIGGLESEVSGQQGTISNLQSAIGDLESRLSALESGNPGGGDPGGGDPGGGDPGGGIVTDGLVLWLPMDEGQGSVVTDQSGLGNDGVINGATWTQLPNGLWYLSFDGTNDVVTVPDSTPLDITSQVTVIAWAYHDANANEFIVAKWTADQGYGMLENGGGKLLGFVTIGNVRKEAISTANIPVATWVNTAVTYNGAIVQSYLDAQPDGSVAATGSLDVTADNFTVGWGINDNFTWDGQIGGVWIYNRALTPQEIQQNYLATIARYQ